MSPCPLEQAGMAIASRGLSAIISKHYTALETKGEGPSFLAFITREWQA